MTVSIEQRARCVTRTGWHQNVFAFPDQTISGTNNDHTVYQGEYFARNYQQAGTLLDWQQNIAALCVGNSRLIFAVSCAFAALLLHPANMESGGIHLVGGSSSGKTTALRVAASVYGTPQYVNRWRATSNGLEAIAALHSDTLLILDELAQVDAREVGEMAYMLANGSGKARASKTGAARARNEWRTLVLSAGEITLSQHMREVGKRTRAGQEVRLADIAADAGADLGVFETLHHAQSAAELSRILMEATAQYYGVPAISFLEKITAKEIQHNLAHEIKKFCSEFIQQNLPSNASGQVHRVCARFALIAYAGELATALGITGWTTAMVIPAITTCFHSWLELRGGASGQERITVLSQVRSFLEAHGESRFTEWNFTTNHTINRAGFKKTNGSGTEFFVLPEAFSKEICAGLDHRLAARILLDEGWLLADEENKPYRREYLPGIGRSRCYVFTSKVWES